MFAFIGIIVGVVATMVGYVMHGGNIGILIQPTEAIILFGAAFGIFLGSNGMAMVQKAIKAITGILRPPASKAQYLELLKLMYQLFTLARKEGLLGLEKHVENPEESELMKRSPTFLGNHHALHFFCDTMKVVLTGAVSHYDLNDLMELDLDTAHAEEHGPVEAIQNVADAMPAVGIVAAVLGIIITMQKIGGDPSAVGHSVAVALVGTFAGIFLGYIVFAPLAKAIDNKNKANASYMNCIRYALLSFARGESPITCVEFARRSIEPMSRPGFVEMETVVKEKEAA